MPAADLTISSLSLEYVKVPVTAVVNGLDHNPTADTVAMAFTAVGTSPVSGNWRAGSWETYTGLYFARCLVGASPGTGALAVGFYNVWLKVTDNPEVPIKLAGTLEVI